MRRQLIIFVTGIIYREYKCSLIFQGNEVYIPLSHQRRAEAILSKYNFIERMYIDFDDEAMIES